MIKLSCSFARNCSASRVMFVFADGGPQNFVWMFKKNTIVVIASEGMWTKLSKTKARLLLSTTIFDASPVTETESSVPPLGFVAAH